MRVLPPQKITTLVQAQKVCKNNAVCGIAGREDTLEFDCVDTTTAFDSCGGCVVPHPFKDSLPSPVIGVECGRLHGVVTAACSNSKCVVSKCSNGLHPVANATRCAANLHARDASAATAKANPDLQSNLGAVTDTVAALAATKATDKLPS
ncbi:hypothetical protein H0H87_010843 [Tephrocybe sp. NHM501043]|nr:hypothetical protein H0H87_010843 [Tephrocybe sp. NHM501043]